MGFVRFLLVALSLTLTLWASETVKPLRVGMELSYPPFEGIDRQGAPAGLSVDLAEALGKYLHRPVVIENLPFIGLIPSLKTDKIDLILSSLTVTPQRAQAIDFSEPYLETGLALLLQKDSAITDIDELDQPGRVAAVKEGTTGEIYALNHLKQAKVLILNDESSGVLEVVQKKADAFIYDPFSIYMHWKKNPDTTKVILTPFYKESWAIGIRKNNPELKKQVNAFLAEFKKNNGIQKLVDKYLPEQKEAFKPS